MLRFSKVVSIRMPVSGAIRIHTRDPRTAQKFALFIVLEFKPRIDRQQATGKRSSGQPFADGMEGVARLADQEPERTSECYEIGEDVDRETMAGQRPKQLFAWTHAYFTVNAISGVR